MAYVKRVVIAGSVRETKKMESLRANTKRVIRSAKQSLTTDQQKKINERSAEERLRWKINANFGYQDLHVVLHYRDSERDVEQSFRDLAAFKARLHILCSRKGIRVKYISMTETIGKNDVANIHHHILLNRMDPELIQEAWEWVSDGWMSYTPLDRRGNHAKLAHYFMKQTKQTMERTGRKIKRFSCSRGLIIPRPVYERVKATSWLEEPRHSEGWTLWKDENGDTVRVGIHETGYPWQEYFEIRTEHQDTKNKRRAYGEERRDDVKQVNNHWTADSRSRG